MVMLANVSEGTLSVVMLIPGPAEKVNPVTPVRKPLPKTVNECDVPWNAS